MSRRRDDDLSPEDRRLWARVTGTVTPGDPVRKARAATPEPDRPAPVTVRGAAAKAAKPVRPLAPPPAPPSTEKTQPHPLHRGPAEALEPRRKRRLARERDPIDASIDLHGYGRFQAQDALTAFLTGAQARGCRAVLVVTGQGRRGGGIIRASIQEWLTAPALRPVVSGFAAAHRRHGGDGAIYVTLRRLD